MADATLTKLIQLFAAPHPAALRQAALRVAGSVGAAKEKALVNAEHYMRKYGGDRSWTQPASVDWREFTPRNVIWET